MTLTEVLKICLVVAIITVAVVLLIGYIMSMPAGSVTTTDSTTTSESSRKKWTRVKKVHSLLKRHWESVWLPVTVYTILIHVLLWKMWPHWLVGYFWELHKTQILMAYGFYVIAIIGLAANDKWRGRVSRILVFCCMLVIGNAAGWFPWVSESWWENRAVVHAAGKTPGGSSLSFLPLNEEGRKIVTEFWNKELPDDNPELMIKISEAESEFNQFEADGVTPYRGRVNSHDIGIMQINETIWRGDAEALGYNIDTLEGNLKMALYIRKTRGASEWTTYKDVLGAQARGMTRTAPLGQSDDGPWSDTIATPWPFRYTASDPHALLAFKRSDGVVVTCDPSPRPVAGKSCDDPDFQIGNTKTLQFQSRGATAVQVTVKRTW